MGNALFLLTLLLAATWPSSHSLPLSTSGRYVVDAATRQRVKLRCVNWASHMPAVLAEGLDRQPLPSIAARVAALGFNCVRLTWATHMFTHARYANLTVAGSLASLDLTDAAAGVERSNPGMMGMTVAEAYDAVVGALGEAGMMVVLDNHVSKPQWCCGGDDGNGFFGDAYFDPEEWIRGLDAVARRFRGVSQVVGMSMRNELRGPNQSESSWYEHVTRGARTIHEANPDVLVIVSGLNYDSDLSFLAARPLALHIDKLVYEAHWYSFSEGRRHEWEDQSPSRVCSGVSARFDRRAGFIENMSTPLFISEFGVDQRGTKRADNRFLGCFLAFAAERDVDWAMWALQGSYYWRSGVAGFEETYGVLDSNWDLPKNPNFQERFRLIQDTIQDPNSALPTYQIIYHPLSGKCLQAGGDQNIWLSDCRNRSRWSYDGDGGPIRLADTDLCLRLEGDETPVALTTECDDETSRWRAASSTGYQLGGVDAEGRPLCLHWSNGNDSSPLVLTKECICLEGSVCEQNPQHQWFTIISSNVA